MSENRGPIRTIRYQRKGEKGVTIGKVWAGRLPSGDTTFADGTPVPDDIQFNREDDAYGGAAAMPYIEKALSGDGWIRQYRPLPKQGVATLGALGDDEVPF